MRKEVPVASVHEVDRLSDLTVETVNDIFALLTSRGDHPAMLWQDQANAWHPIPAAEIYARTRALAARFKQWGIVKGDRIALLSENRWEWAVTDFAALALGAVDVPLYATNTADQIGYMVRDSGARVVVVSTADQYQKLRSAGELPAVEHVVVMDAGDFPDAESFADLVQHDGTARDPGFDAQVASIQPDDLATIIYTSGTTGQPKGVMLTHGNLASNVQVSATPYGFDKDDSCISFLPLSHVTARHADYSLMCRGSLVAYLPKFDRLPAAMKAVRPTVFVAVPRVYEKLRQAVESKSAQSPLRKRLLAWALATGRQHRPEILVGRPPSSLLWKLADKLVFAKIREAFGGRVRTFVAGGAPLGPDTAGWFADAGIRLFEGYGMTETSPVIAANQPNAHRLGSVGVPMKNLKLRFAPDGELEVRGPSVFKSYWNKEEETRASFSDDGFFRTGDIGKLEDGFLSITDRKKELLKTSGGKLVAPQPIENSLKANGLIGNAALVGDRHKFISVLIQPNFEALNTWAKAQGIAAEGATALIEQPRVKAEYKRIVDDVNKNLAPFEAIKRIRIVPEEWTIEHGEMTPSMKLKRRVIERKYEKEIADFYRDEATVKG
jgi:long-chain acyl-CoA synthetase